MQVVRETDYIWRFEHDAALSCPPMLVGLLAATEHLTVGKAYLQPGQKSPLHMHDGDESLLLTQGRLNVFIPDAEGQRWFELNPMDGFYVPAGVPHQYFNMTGEPVELLFGVAPTYAPPNAPVSNA